MKSSGRRCSEEEGRQEEEEEEVERASRSAKELAIRRLRKTPPRSAVNLAINRRGSRRRTDATECGYRGTDSRPAKTAKYPVANSAPAFVFFLLDPPTPHRRVEERRSGASRSRRNCR